MTDQEIRDTLRQALTDWDAATPEQREEAAYEAHMAAELARQEAECGCPYTTGPAHDPYGTACDLPKGHDRGEDPTDHSGPNPVGGDDPITWTRARGARERLRSYE